MLCERPWVAVLVALPLVLIWSWALLDEGHPTLLILLFGIAGQPQAEPQSQRAQDTAFLRQAVDVEFPSPIDYAPLREACASNGGGFRPGLLFTCEGQHGGVGMARNQILKCVRYAMHAGAAIVVPSMSKRNPKDISDIETSTEVPLEYLFDRQAFVQRLSAACPDMQIYSRKEDLPHYEHRALADAEDEDDRRLVLVGDQFDRDHPLTGIRHPETWRASFDAWLAQKGISFSPTAPVHVRIDQAFLEYPVAADGAAFAREYGKILSFRQDTRVLAAKVLLALRNRFSLPIEPSAAVSPDAFYGAHLRLEKDAVEAWAPADGWRYSVERDQFEEQFRNLARFPGLNVVYVASGNLTVVELFAAELARRVMNDKTGVWAGRKNITVVTKHDLLPSRSLDGLTFDQQALVDFLVMFRASAFMGVAHSSFPWNVALRRHGLSRYAAVANEGSDLLRDEYSVIMGKRADYPHIDPFEYGLWP